MFATGYQNGTIQVWDLSSKDEEPIYTNKSSSTIRTVSWPYHGFLIWGDETGSVYGSVLLDNAKAFRAPESSLSSSSTRYNSVLHLVVTNENHTSDMLPKFAKATVLYEDGTVHTSRLALHKAKFERTQTVIPAVSSHDLTTKIVVLRSESKSWVIHGTLSGYLFGVQLSL
jgi:hypothetical protein